MFDLLALLSRGDHLFFTFYFGSKFLIKLRMLRVWVYFLADRRRAPARWIFFQANNFALYLFLAFIYSLNHIALFLKLTSNSFPVSPLPFQLSPHAFVLLAQFLIEKKYFFHGMVLGEQIIFSSIVIRWELQICTFIMVLTDKVFKGRNLSFKRSQTGFCFFLHTF